MTRPRTKWISTNGNGTKPADTPAQPMIPRIYELPPMDGLPIVDSHKLFLSPPEHRDPNPDGSYPVGRPPKYHESHPRRAYALLARTGCSQVDLTAAFGITIATLNTWIQEHEEFSRAVRQGWYDWRTGAVVKALAQRAVGFCVDEEKVFCNNGEIITHRTPKYYPPDVTALMYWLNNRMKGDWAHATKVEHSGKVQTEEVGPAAMELAALLKKASKEDLKHLRTSILRIAESANEQYAS